MPLFGKTIKDPVLENLEAKEKGIFTLEKHELNLADDIISNIKNAEKLVKTGIDNTKHIIERRMHNHPDSHDLDFKDVADEFKDASELFDKAKHASVSFMEDIKRITKAVVECENIINKSLPSVRASKKEIKYLVLFKQSEFDAIHELPPIDGLMINLANKLKDLEPFIKNLNENVRRPNKDHAIMNRNNEILRGVLLQFANLNKHHNDIHKRMNRFKDILHNINHRMKEIKFEDHRLHAEVLAHLRKAREADIKRNKFKMAA